MKMVPVVAGVILIIFGLIGFGYAALSKIQPNVTIGWILGLIFIIIGGYLIGTELKKQDEKKKDK
jgi:putative Mn2+ efflux pump MntP